MISFLAGILNGVLKGKDILKNFPHNNEGFDNEPRTSIEQNQFAFLSLKYLLKNP